MIFTRRFGALRARTVVPSVPERDREVEYHGDSRFVDARSAQTENEESAA
jgi:hypothetical protein